MRFWVAPLSVARIPVIKENINEKIKRALDEAGIEVPYPYMKLIMDDGVDDIKKVILEKPSDTV